MLNFVKIVQLVDEGYLPVRNVPNRNYIKLLHDLLDKLRLMDAAVVCKCDYLSGASLDELPQEAFVVSLFNGPLLLEVVDQALLRVDCGNDSLASAHRSPVLDVDVGTFAAERHPLESSLGADDLINKDRSSPHTKFFSCLKIESHLVGIRHRLSLDRRLLIRDLLVGNTMCFIDLS